MTAIRLGPGDPRPWTAPGLWPSRWRRGDHTRRRGHRHEERASARFQDERAAGELRDGVEREEHGVVPHLHRGSKRPTVDRAVESKRAVRGAPLCPVRIAYGDGAVLRGYGQIQLGTEQPRVGRGHAVRALPHRQHDLAATGDGNGPQALGRLDFGGNRRRHDQRRDEDAHERSGTGGLRRVAGHIDGALQADVVVQADIDD